MQTKLLDAKKPGAIEEAAELLRKGYLIAFPTDTLYGIGANIHNPAAISRLYQVKNRPMNKGIPILISDINDLHQVAGEISPLARILIGRYWPGPLTLIVPRRADLPAALSPNNSIAVRIPANDVARSLIHAAGGAVAASSANHSGEAPALSAAEALAAVDEGLTAILDGGAVRHAVASTVVDTTNSQLRVLREGPVTTEELMLAAVDVV